MDKVKLAIYGAAGRMGERLVALGTQDEKFQIAAALESHSHVQLGKDAGLISGIEELGIPLRSVLDFRVDAVIDFSAPEATDSVIDMCVEHGSALVEATTGLSEAQRDRLVDASKKIPIVWAPNMSLAVNLTMKLTEVAAEALADHPSGTDVEIIERHHRYKADSPSGTALEFGRLIAQKMEINQHVHGRQGRPGERPRDEIGYHAVRTGDNPGEHTIVFGLLGETVELTVRATNRDCYALGALAAARFVVDQEPGLYSMYDVLGLE